MSKPTAGLRKAGLAALSVTLTFGAGVAAAGTASALPGFEFDRLPGENRYDTAGMAADEYDNLVTAPVTDVIIANGTDGHFADALAGNYLSSLEGAPILLTRADRIPPHTQDALERLNPENVWIVGGEAVVPQAIEDELAENYNVQRLGGDNRYETAAAVIRHGGVAASDTAVISTGLNFADSLAAGPMVYGEQYPLGLTRADRVPDPIIDALQAAEIGSAIIVGGEGVVGAGAREDLAEAGIEVIETLAGDDRAATSVEVAEFEISTLGYTDTAVNVASGYNEGDGADALAGGPVTGEQERPLLITRSDTNVDDQDNEILNFLQANCDTLAEGLIFGGLDAIAQNVEDDMEEAAVCEAPATNQDFTATPQEEATNVLVPNNPDADNSDDRQYTVTGLDNAETYTIALVPADNVTVDNNGVVTFADDEDNTPNNSADDDGAADDLGNVAADITVINGTATGTGALETAQPVNGQINFTIDGDAFESVRPVLFVDEDTTGSDLDLDANNQPTELFAIGGIKNWVPTEAGFGAVDGEITEIARDQNYLLLDTTVNANQTPGDSTTPPEFTLFYDSNDSYRVDGVGVSMAEFERLAGAGADLEANYNPNETGVSVFNLLSTTVDAPNNVTAEVRNLDNEAKANDVVVDWTASESEGVVYDVYRSDDANFDGGDTRIANDLTDTQYTAADQPDNADWSYFVVAQDPTTGAESEAAGPATVAVPPAADQDDPEAQDTELTTSGGFAGRLDAGDVIKVCFNEALAAPNAGDAIQVQDETTTPGTFDGDVATLVNGQNATFALGTAPTGDVSTPTGNCPANQTLVITVTGAVADQNTGVGNGIVELPAQITDAAGVTDVNGNNWRPDNEDVDRIIDTEAGAEAGDEQNTVAPTLDSVAATALNTLRTDWSENILTGSPVAASFDVYSENTCTNVFSSGTTDSDDDGDQIVDVTLGTALVEDTQYWFQAAPGAVQDENGNPNVATACVAFTPNLTA